MTVRKFQTKVTGLFKKATLTVCLISLYHREINRDFFRKILELFVKQTSSPTGVVQNLAGSTWTISMTIMCWFILLIFTHFNRLSSISILCMLAPLAGLRSVYFQSFFLGCLLATCSNEMSFDIYQDVPLFGLSVAFMPLPLLSAKLSELFSGSVLLQDSICLFISMPLFALWLIKSISQYELTQKYGSAIGRYTASLYFFSSPLQKILLNDFDVKTPGLNCAFAIVLSMLISWIWSQ